MALDLHDLHLAGIDPEAAEVNAAIFVGEAILFRQMLQEYDPELNLLRAKENAEPPLKPGYWYIVRGANKAVGRTPAWWEVSNPDGSYCMPRQEHFDRLKEKDSWTRPGLYHEYRKRQEEAKRQRQKTNEQLHAEFREKLNERLKHNHSPAVAVSALPEGMRAAAAAADRKLAELQVDQARRELQAADADMRVVELDAVPELPDLVPEAGEPIAEIEQLPGPNRAQRRAMRNKALTRARHRPLR